MADRHARKWHWEELIEFLDHFGITLNGFTASTGLKQSSLSNVRTGIINKWDPKMKGTKPREPLQRDIEAAMLRLSKCEHCHSTLVDGRPYAEFAGQAGKATRKTA